ncbi:hypothetical protein V8E51_016855 [Hyaloscypha variabilis]|uniref:Fibronectin type-III domain-containing protein n=1 Tax=Hyaloscypha variabilis (strain UAMH 11265 / GT02V1 / F) TaxID=1149755 RepID=A0A2J6RIV9_HYAVF|nr:hypothetical protein L207DRAFT_430723 [Hyaloscypha variabilis F]
MFLIQSIATCYSLGWLLWRAWQTLWKPVPELISTLGVEVPDAPEVSLAGIRSDAITLHWSPPGASKPVIRYGIQVNGVNVGESTRSETAITVTGLRPGHFYNVRVIAIGSNNFQAQSEVLRLRTYGRDGRPILTNGRVPSNLLLEDHKTDNDDNVAASAVVGIEAVPLAEGSQAMVREPSASHTSQRRNTGGRKHSPSIAAADQPPLPTADSNQSGETMHELTEKFETIRVETEDIMAQQLKDKDEFDVHMKDLSKERDEKKHLLREKERASERLKREVHQSEQTSRQAQARRAQKEKVLRDKKAEIAKVHEDMIKWKEEIEDMKVQQQAWEKQQVEMKQEKETEVRNLQEIIEKHQTALLALEEDIRIKGLHIKDLEEERQKLLGNEDDEASKEQDEKDRQEDQEWETQEKSWVHTLNHHSHQLRHIETMIHQQQGNLAALTAQQAANPIMYHGNSSGVDFDPTGGQGKVKPRRPRNNRKSRTSTISSPIAAHPIGDSPYPSANAYNNLNKTTSPIWAPGPYIDMNNDNGFVSIAEQAGMSDDEVRQLTAGAPLSPTAHALLPSNIFDAEDDPPSPRQGSARGSFGPPLFGGGFENDEASPDSSSRSASLMSSPQNSTQNLAIYGVSGRDSRSEQDRRSLNSPRAGFGAIGSPPPIPSAAEQSTSRFGNLFNLARTRGKTMQEDGPTLGSLKQGQSQSFPRSTDEPDVTASRRRISFSSPSWNVSFLRGSAAGEPSTAGNAPAPARNLGARSRRGFNIFGSSTDDTVIHPERDPSSPRPLSIASSDLPRPSTDSAPFGWGPAHDNVVNRNSPLATNWSHTPAPNWSTNPSRRPSLQHGSTTALTALGKDDGSFPDDHADPPPGVGVIGTRPSSSHKPVTPKLNPAAPAFKGFSFLGSKSGKDKGKGKEKAVDTPTSTDDSFQKAESSSPAEPRPSKDTPSIRTQNSMAESYESLERTSSNTPSEMTTPSAASAKEKESAFKQLLRKGSASKFSMSFRNKESGLFSAKKGGSSAANSDRNASVERDASLDEYGEDAGFGRSADSVTSSPMVGSTGSGEWGKPAGTPKEGRKSMNWSRFGMKKKGRESSEVDRSEAETTGTEDEA